MRTLSVTDLHFVEKTAFSNKNLKKKENFHMTEQQTSGKQQKYEEDCAHFLKFHKAE
jgi:hypothetical protein